MTRDDIAAVMAKIPGLTALGNFPYEGGPKQTDAELSQDRERLLSSEESCSAACQWLATKAKTKTVNRKRSSYGLKHLAEDEIGYVTNGAFIAAAVHSGFPYEILVDSPNVLIGISEKSLKSTG